MTKLILGIVVAIVVVGWVVLQDLQAQTQTGPFETYQAAHQAAEQDGQQMVILLGAAWCPHCQVMKTRILPRLREQGLLKNRHLVYVDADHDKARFNQLADPGRDPNNIQIPQLILFSKTKEGWTRRQLVNEATLEQTAGFLGQP